MITPIIFEFLSHLKENNNREWFHANKEMYNKARGDFEIFVNLAINEISKFDPSIVSTDAKDCIFRIFRDVRFSKNKMPYKPNFGAYIIKGGRKSNMAGYYVHVEPGASFLAGGIYMPPSDILKVVRNEIYENPDEFKNIINNAAFKQYFQELFNEKLTNPPRGFPKEFEDIELLKYKHYIVDYPVKDTDLLNRNFIEGLMTDVFKQLTLFNSFLNRAINENL
ncbi:MAG: DUF2461 domain-containing protein [Bacteroidales bacterium]|nr:DUF2461 domain-containing protein [Bacteroidales bacterium]